VLLGRIGSSVGERFFGSRKLDNLRIEGRMERWGQNAETGAKNRNVTSPPSSTKGEQTAKGKPLMQILLSLPNPNTFRPPVIQRPKRRLKPSGSRQNR